MAAVCALAIVAGAGFTAVGGANAAESTAASATAAGILAGSQIPESDQMLWYSAPAANWETQSLPIGGGHQGANVFGGLASERLSLNVDSLWSGGPGSKEGWTGGNWPSDGSKNGKLKEVRDEITANGSMNPGAVASKLGIPSYSLPGGVIPGFGSYLNFGQFYFDVPDASGTSNYRRDLNLGNAVAGVSYTKGNGAKVQRSFFSSYPDNVLVSRFAADRAGEINFTTRFTSPNGAVQTAAGNRITVKGVVADNGLKYEMQAHVVTDGGTVTVEGNDLKVTGATSATMFMTMGTDYKDNYPTYRGVDPHAAVTAAVDGAVAKGHDAVKAAHIADYKGLYDNMSLNLSGHLPAGVPTNTLRSAYKGNGSEADKALETLFFNYGRYMMIASSRPGSLPANLQGLWNDRNTPPWQADYHTNINLQMNYWLSEVTNLSETAEPLNDFMEALVEPGKVTSKSIFGADSPGWIVNQNTNIFGFTGVHDWAESFWMPEAAAWMMQPVYEHYAFTGDKTYLADKAYPMMKGAAEFWIHNLQPDPHDNNRLVVTPSYSPEQGPFTAGAAMSQQIVVNLLKDILEAAQELNTDTAFQASLASTLNKMDPGLAVGSWGQIKEWKIENTSIDTPTNQHRHASNLFALFPGDEIDVRNDPVLAAAARKSLDARGDGATGWSKAWKISFLARLLDGDGSQKMLSALLKNNVYDNLWDAHPPFQIDGNFGATSGVAEMLLQSQSSAIDLLPALPANWATGAVSGLKARGNVEVGLSWAGGAATGAVLQPASSGPLSVRSGMFDGKFSIKNETTGAAVATPAVVDGVVTFNAVGGQKYLIAATANTTIEAPASIAGGSEFDLKVNVNAPGAALAAGSLKLTVPAGWTVAPATAATPAVAQGTTAQATFKVKPSLAPLGSAKVVATLSSGGSTLTAEHSIVVTDPTVVPCTAMAVTSVSSEETASENGRGTNMTDCDANTPWHTAWSTNSTPPPHWAIVDLGSTMKLTAAGCTPRPQLNGRITKASMATSIDGTTWSAPTVATWANNTDAKWIQLGGVEARYVKFTGIETLGDGPNANKWVTCGEFNARKAVGDGTTPTPTPTPTPTATATATPTGPAGGTIAPVLCSDMTVTGFSSQETAAEQRPASNLVDCNKEPGWSTAWSASSTPPPHWVTIDLGKSRNLVSAGCQGRDSANGRIKDVTMETSLDGTTWAAAVPATWANTTAVQSVALNGSPARYVRMTGVTSYEQKWIACGEFVASERIADPTPTPTPSASATPTLEPTVEPTVDPTVEPSVEPTVAPTLEPTVDPTLEPSAGPSTSASASPQPSNSAGPSNTATASATKTSGSAAVVAAARGGKLVVTGAGFTPNEQVVAVIRSTPLAMGSYTADAKGKVSVSWKVPVDFALGEHTVTLTGQASKHAVVVPVLITAMESAVAVPGVDGVDELPSTGSTGVAMAVAFGLLILAVGVLLVVRSRKRYMPKRA
ncbi:glycosyl hydrolase family 95 catalytic domain-containing protein [Arthrobacter sp. HY1533]|uniref:glycosyl hydrolase family 95 catalytic domain-containing protein n=1 Tax=Arthrobacter sp. HY1533 TaxID=2970919 RepID=UPI0022BA0C15|nr:glycoside hydrolase N-terminal domain-containing protein [Arthrobacter sp. HY1533]